MLLEIARQVLNWLLSDFKMSRFELDEFQDRDEAGGPIQGSRHTVRPEQDFVREQQELAFLLIRDGSQH